MLARGIILRFGLLAAISALALLAFFSVSHAQKTEAHGLQPSCTFTTPLPQLITGGGGPDSVTCTFTIAGTAHTLIVDFTFSLTQTPVLQINSCTLDSTAIHIGPCP